MFWARNKFERKVERKPTKRTKNREKARERTYREEYDYRILMEAAIEQKLYGDGRLEPSNAEKRYREQQERRRKEVEAIPAETDRTATDREQ